jgi:transposase
MRGFYQLEVGLDMGWTSFRYEVRDEADRRIERGGEESTPAGLRRVLAKYQGKERVRVSYEAGTQMYWVDEVVKGMGMESYPFHAASFALIVKSRNKTDKKDAETIARAAVKEILPAKIVVAEGEERELRELMSERETRKRELVSYGNQLHALAIREGFSLYASIRSTKEEDWEQAVSRFEGRARAEAKRVYRMALVLFQILEEVEGRIQELTSTGELGEARRRLETHPGIGRWLAWCGPRAARFANGRKAASYFGLVGSTYESGQVSRLGSITKAGPPLVRRLLMQAAWAFLRSREGQRSGWGRWFARQAKGKKRIKIAVVGLARRIVTAAVASLRNQTDWDAQRLLGVGGTRG